MSLRDKLARLDPAQAPKPRREHSDEDWIIQLEYELQIRTVREQRSFFLLKENSYPIFEDRAFRQVQEQGMEMEHLHLLCPDLRGESCNLSELVFIDTETTGLAGGAGTYAFLVGIGHIEMNRIVVRQYLLPDFDGEWLMLQHLESILQGYRYTVSFNGKSFDLPLLKTRYILNRQETVLEDIQHLDILHAARRLWKRRLPACDLQSLERHILDVHRVEDVPGDLIPQLYFEFIRKRQAFLLRNVLEHNFHDIVNMALLTVRLGCICAEPLSYLQEAGDMYSLAHYYYQSGKYAASIELSEHLLSAFPAGDPWISRAQFLLSMGYKKTGQTREAGEYLRDLFERKVFHPTVIEELAKFYEHEERDFACALEVVNSGLAYLETIRQLSPRSPMMKHLAPFLHRRKRLQRKLQSAVAE